MDVLCLLCSPKGVSWEGTEQNQLSYPRQESCSLCFKTITRSFLHPPSGVSSPDRSGEWRKWVCSGPGFPSFSIPMLNRSEEQSEEPLAP